jgi:hypothetical protein
MRLVLRNVAPLGHAEHDSLQVSPAADPDFSVTSADYAARRRTYRGFLRLVRYAIAGIAIILIFLAWLRYG